MLNHKQFKLLHIQSLVWTFYLVMRMSDNEKDTGAIAQVAAPKILTKRSC